MEASAMSINTLIKISIAVVRGGKLMLLRPSLSYQRMKLPGDSFDTGPDASMFRSPLLNITYNVTEKDPCTKMVITDL